jgi:hypothetical protein
MKTSANIGAFVQRVCEILWAAALICLPITTFPLFSSLTGALVAPLSILPFALLFLLWSLPVILRKGVIPKETIPLGVFILVVILSCAAAYFFYIPGFKDKSIPGQEMRALFTLAIGVIFYLVTTTWINHVDKLKNSLKYITIGGILSLLWTGFQAYFILQHAEQYPAWLDQIQSWFVVQSPAFTARFGRVNGLAYEASWFANQMVLIYLPIWIAASYEKTSAFTLRIWRISVENILLVIGLGAFLLSSPRIGLASFFLMVIYIFIRINRDVYRKIVNCITNRNNIFRQLTPKYRKFIVQVMTGTLIVVGYILILAGAFFLLIQRDYRLALLVTQPPSLKEIIGLLTLDQNALIYLSSRFIFLERVVYWLSGWNVFNQYPLLGVGLGNSGFFFPGLAPAIGWATYEIRNVLYYLPQLPNVKSLWFRLLAETGLVGFSVFLSWIYVLYQSSRFSQHNQDPTMKTIALAGQLALLAFIGEGFSVDSFAMPYFWIAAGLTAAAAMIYRQQITAHLVPGGN